MKETKRAFKSKHSTIWDDKPRTDMHKFVMIVSDHYRAG